MTSLFQILLLLIGVAKFIVFAHLILSWLIMFDILNRHQPIVFQLWNGLSNLLEPAYRPIRRILPHMSGIDLSPLVVLLGLYCLEIILRNNAF